MIKYSHAACIFKARLKAARYVDLFIVDREREKKKKNSVTSIIVCVCVCVSPMLGLFFWQIKTILVTNDINLTNLAMLSDILVVSSRYEHFGSLIGRSRLAYSPIAQGREEIQLSATSSVSAEDVANLFRKSFLFNNNSSSNNIKGNTLLRPEFSFRPRRGEQTKDCYTHFFHHGKSSRAKAPGFPARV